MFHHLMPCLTLQTARFRNNTRPIIWLDVEKRKADTEPALTSVHWGDALTTYVLDPILAESAKAKKLEFRPQAKLAAEIVRTAMATNSFIAGYSISEQELLMSACPEDAAWIKANYLNANAAKCSPCRLFSALNVAWRCQVAERVLRSATPPSSRRLSI